jgi:hypothetical protein
MAETTSDNKPIELDLYEAYLLAKEFPFQLDCVKKKCCKKYKKGKRCGSCPKR